jgi:hypothetical protein
LSMADSMMLMVVQVVVSWMNGRSPNFGVFFAIPIESNHSGFCWLNILCAELWEIDAVWPVGAIVWVTSHCTVTLWAYIDCSQVGWDLYVIFVWMIRSLCTVCWAFNDNQAAGIHVWIPMYISLEHST